MNKTKLFAVTLAIFSMVFGFNAKSLAEAKVGLVDMTKVIQNYDKAKDAQATLLSSQEQIKNMIAKAREQVEGIKEEKAKQEKEKKLAAEIMEKNNAFKKDFSKKWDGVQTKILQTIKKVADNKGLDLVVEKQTVIAGGEDITNDVLKELKK